MYAILLAGGSGTRLWPYSRTMSPKQFLALGATPESLFQETCQRLAPLVPPKNLWVIGSQSHEHELRLQLAQIVSGFPDDHVLLEPVGRNTAPAVLWGALQIPEDQQEEPLLVVSADHLIGNPEGFVEAVRSAVPLAEEGWLITFGIRPDHPETGYGYIQSGAPLSVGFRVSRFVEKPDAETAQRLATSSDHTWNAGIFLATAATFLQEFQQHTPELFRTFEPLQPTSGVPQAPEAVAQAFASAENISIDYAVMEKSHRIAVLPVEMAWSDLGSWENLHQVSEKDADGNVLRGNVICRDTRNSLIISTKKLVTSIGVENLVIVETEDALLVCDLRRTQDVKQLVETLKEEDRHEYRFHTRVLRPWGSATTVLENAGFRIRLLEVRPGASLSLQRHRHRSEHWVVTKGTADVQRSDESLLLTESESIYIPKGVPHRLGNSGPIPLEVIEVQQGSYLGDDDIERFEDASHA